MRAPWVGRRSRRGLRRCVAGLSLVCLVGSLTGVPLPATAVRKDVSVAFPCQDRPCGCQSAQECRLHCCCFNEEQKRLWAEGRGVDPATVLPPAPKKEWSRTRKPETAKKSCCEVADASHRPAEPIPSCCSASASAEVADEGAGKCCAASSEPRPRRLVLGLFHGKCRGAAEGWLALKWSAPAPVLLHCLFSDAVDACAACAAESPVEVCTLPSVPPPRSLSL